MMSNLKRITGNIFSHRLVSKKTLKAAVVLTAVGILALTLWVNFYGPAPAQAASSYVVLAWSDQGMHFYNRDFRYLAFAPPYNTLRAQVILYGGVSPRIITSGITVEYSFPENTSSAKSASLPAKTNFWKYAKKLFGVTLAPNEGLKGKGLSGKMDLNGDHFVAEGIPLTEFTDAEAAANKKKPLLWQRSPYQLADIVVRNAGTGVELARTKAVSAVSTEISCGNCHGGGGPVADLKGTMEKDIFTRHDSRHGTEFSKKKNQPVLCARCHASNAPGVNSPGLAGFPSLSKAIHTRHAGFVSQDTNGCYNCHPGPNTQGLRDVMSANFGFQCTTCHGAMAEIAQKANPWVEEPRCDSASCHGPSHAMDQPRYTISKGGHDSNHIYCAGCHDSAHAVAPSSQPNDNIRFMNLQTNKGPVGTGGNCTVCHSGSGNRGNSCNTCHGDMPRLTPHTAPASMEGGGGGD